jgi:hypothetical protein
VTRRGRDTPALLAIAPTQERFSNRLRDAHFAFWLPGPTTGGFTGWTHTEWSTGGPSRVEWTTSLALDRPYLYARCATQTSEAVDLTVSQFFRLTSATTTLDTNTVTATINQSTHPRAFMDMRWLPGLALDGAVYTLECHVSVTGLATMVTGHWSYGHAIAAQVPDDPNYAPVPGGAVAPVYR